MTKTLKIPEFESESQEATWWDEHPTEILETLKRSATEGTLSRGMMEVRATSKATSIRLDPTDIALAKEQAERLGLRYQTYLKSIIRQALRREASGRIKA